MLPDGETTITLLGLYNLIITHHSLEKVVKFVSLCPGLEELDVREVKCAEHNEKVQVGKDQEKAQSEKRFPLQKPRWEKTKLTIRYLYHETYRKPNEQLFSQ